MAYDSGGYRSLALSFSPTPMVKRLLIANTAIFMVTWAVNHPAVFDWFSLQPRNLVFRPWGPFTYMFLHAGVGHLLANMLGLFFFGPALEAKWGEHEFLKFYVICGLGGAALSLVTPAGQIVGASAAVLGVLLAFAMNWPDMEVHVWGIFPIQAKWLIAIITLLTLMAASSGSSSGGIAHFAHLGGMLAGFLYLKADWRAARRMADVKRAVTKKRRLAIVPGEESDGETVQVGTKAPKREDAALYDKVDAVLDKISAEGMSALTPDELELLDEMSKKHRTN